MQLPVAPCTACGLWAALSHYVHPLPHGKMGAREERPRRYSWETSEVINVVSLVEHWTQSTPTKGAAPSPSVFPLVLISPLLSSPVFPSPPLRLSPALPLSLPLPLAHAGTLQFGAPHAFLHCPSESGSLSGNSGLERVGTLPGGLRQARP